MKIQSINLNHVVTDLPLVTSSSRGFLNFGDDNLYPSYLLRLYNLSSIHHAIINMRSDLAAGNGFIHSDNKELTRVLKTANYKESFNDILKKVSLDYMIHNYFALNIIWSKDGSEIAAIHHIDASKTRIGSVNEFGEPETFFIKNDWSHRRGNMIELPTFNPIKSDKEPSQLLYVQTFQPGIEFYSLPEYEAGKNYIELDVELGIFNLNNVKNGFAPGTIIAMKSTPPPEEQEQFRRDLEKTFSGTRNAGKFLLLWGTPDVDAPEITTFDQNNNANMYMETIKLATSRIITTHRLPSPLMAGIYEQGQGSLGGNGNELQSAFDLYHNFVIRPIQNKLISTFKMLLQFKDVETDDSFDISNLKSIEVSQEKIDDSVSVNEVREESGLEQIGDTTND